MFGLDDWIASFSDGATLLLILGVAVLLGLRHATDPDQRPTDEGGCNGVAAAGSGRASRGQGYQNSEGCSIGCRECQ